MSTIEKFKEALREESDYPLSDQLYDYIVSNSEEVNYARKEPIIDFGSVCPDIFIIKRGVVRGYMIDKDIEANIYFGLQGTLLNSMQSFSNGEPSIIRIEPYCNTALLRIRKEVYDRMMRESHEFCMWMAGVFARRCAFNELKAKIMDGDAKWRFQWLEKCRPELLESVPQKAIASYLNMTPVHVCRINRMIESEKEENENIS